MINPSKSNILLAISFMMVGCNTRVSREAIIGRYVRSSDYGKETLELKANGQYVHLFKLGEEEVRNTGHWEVDYVLVCPGDPSVVILDARYAPVYRSPTGLVVLYSRRR